MKKNSIYIIISVLIGLLGGYLIFGGDKINHNHDHSKEGIGERWSCSMHPQIDLPEPGDCPICGMDLIPVQGDIDGVSVNEFKMTENALALANIQTTIIGETSEGDNIFKLSGKITQNEKYNAVQVSYFGGQVEQLYINTTGEKVRKGQLLATIFSPELVATQQELITAASIKTAQPELYNAVRNKLRLLKVSETQIEQIEKTGKVKESFPVYATLSGTISEKIVEQGDYVKQGQPLYKIANLTTVWASFDAYENQISDVKTGQKVVVTSKAYPNQEHEAKISFIDPILNTKTRTLKIRATLDNAKNLFKPGMFVLGEIKSNSQTVSQNLSIPSSAVLWTGKRSLVYVKTNPDMPVFEMREVVVENKDGKTFIVHDGLQKGEEIVTNGTFTVDAAAQLQGKKSMMNRKETSSSGSSDHQDVINDANKKLPKMFQEKFSQIFPPYFEMKNAFIVSDIKKVSISAKNILTLLNTLDMSLLDEKERLDIENSKNTITKIIASDNIDTQRKYFIVFNEHVIKLIKLFDQVEQSFYVQKCPMANDNNGALWLSLEQEIRNPYYGNMMLNCGSVIETIQKQNF
ncbi:efflux RND transporter periplasmic adaptor subunit [Aquimarina sp. AU474]|uniref:efflux RND transporter periplasmic adaptor subunit n=1 Tax=Aquimarina sp. AU474 TaxID=2108529 RepID=UPI000D686DCE|nr:efflux RND transporter periplasmic adaptor subunit [Aquimarina sp. AU474]